MRSFLLALQFLTIIPVKIKHIDERKLAKSIIYFPLIGLLLGLVLAGINSLFLKINFPELSINIILVVSLIVLTGGLHLDGLADTFDALFSRKNKQGMLEIMRDSRIGAMGVLSLISIVLLKIAFLSSLSVSLKTTALLLMCILSRWALVLCMFLFPYARKEGKAKVFIQGMTLKILILSTLIALASTFAIYKIKGLLVFVIIALNGYTISKFINNKIGGITGDILGAINELNEVIALFSICILERINLWII
jgi:adenosylcobinamide-GDP ribazoletransferase